MNNEEFPSWFYNVHGDKNFKNHIGYLKNKKCSILQIGVFTGDASVWLYENILKNSDSVLVDVDTWEGSNEESHRSMNWSTVESVYDFKTKEGQDLKKIIKYKGTSDNFFNSNTMTYDFIYIDGDHKALSVFSDAVNSFSCLKVGGIIGFDDYMWGDQPKPFLSPKAAIDSFLLIFTDYVEVIHSGYQVYIRKHTEIEKDFF